ncbi:hypothetical protein ACE38V_01120 [Cytobacillus sp. Hz8]|uniref:hypothetical protein n=1 Tax=Cytobacillus sp. Hz8 TaxID=3347168 RepID=UPI0035D654B2
MAEFLSTFIFILPGIMAYFWLQVFGLNPSVKHTAPELSGIAALLWLPVSFITLLIINTWGALISIKYLSVQQVWTVESLSKATSDIKYLFLFLVVSFIVSFFLCWVWSLWGNEFLRARINDVRNSRNIAPLSSSTTVWEEFFIKYEKDKNKKANGKEAVYRVYKIDKKEDYIIGSMTKASRPLESDKALVLEATEEWKNTIKANPYKINRIYIDTKSGMVVEEIDHKFFDENSIPEDNN